MKPDRNASQEESAKAERDDINFPALLTATIMVLMVVVLMWLFVPGRLGVVRARDINRPAAGITAPPAQEVRRRLESHGSSGERQETNAAAPATRR